MKNLLIDTLETFGYPVILQGTLAENEQYPDNFITFQTIGSPEQDFLDGEPHGTQWRYAVIFYSSDPEIIPKKSAEIFDKLKEAGFIPQGKGTDILSDEPTHTGWVMEFIYLEN